jgi:predicted nuclease of predicted toxin-antitoxin system
VKLLFDQNISFKIIPLIKDFFPESASVVHLNLQDASDITIFQYARINGFSVVTFDSDFVDLSIVKGIPPMIIWLRTGNLTTSSIANLLLSQHQNIHQFLEQHDDGVLEILALSGKL